MRTLEIADGKITGERETDEGVFGLEATLPAIVSISEKSVDEARFPSFKGIMAAKKKEVVKLSLAEVGVESEDVGGANSAVHRRSPPRRSRRRPLARRSPTRAKAAARSPSTWSPRRSSSSLPEDFPDPELIGKRLTIGNG